MHMGVQDVVEGAVLMPMPAIMRWRPAAGGQGPMEEHVAKDGLAEEQRKGPQPNPSRR